MTAVRPASVTGYWPEFPDDVRDHDCHGACDAPAFGRTVYWTGRYPITRYQCREHLPAEPVMYPAVTR